MYTLIFLSSVLVCSQADAPCDNRQLSMETLESAHACFDRQADLWTQAMSLGRHVIRTSCTRTGPAPASGRSFDVFNRAVRIDRIQLANFQSSLLQTGGVTRIDVRPGRTTKISINFTF